jgi:putative redox protein
MKGNTTAQMRWRAGVVFDATTGSHTFRVDGDSAAGASPMQHLLVALGGCMGIDIADILVKMRTPPGRLDVALEGERPAEPPRRFTRVTMTLRIEGDVPLRNVERAIALSRDRYCSVWRTFGQDTVLEVDIELIPTPLA